MIISYPSTLAIVPLSKAPAARVRVPGSKSLTNRALVLAALAEPRQGGALRGALQSEDTEVMVEGLRALGFPVRADWLKSVVQVEPRDDDAVVPATRADLFVGNSGTTMRFLTALVSLGSGRYRLDGVARMRERPIGDLLDALRALDADAVSEQGNGCPPVVVQASGLKGGRVRIRGDVSSQFLSALLMVAPLARAEVIIEVAGPLVSVPYVAMTVRLMEQFGVQVATSRPGTFRVPGRTRYRGRVLDIEPDASAASYFFAAAAVTGGEVCVAGLDRGSLQGDLRFVDLLADMGCQVRAESDGLCVRGGRLRGIDVDMNDVSDCVMTLGAVACFAEGPTTIRNVAHIRHKETDRILALATELRRVGAAVEELADGLRITPGPLHGAEVATYSDHRMAMSMALIGLRVPGVVIRDPACVAKTYPRFFEDLEALRGRCGAIME